MNQVNLIGRTSRDVKFIEKGQVAYLTIAIDNPFKKSQDGKIGTDFIPVTLFGQAAKYASEFVKKGHLIAIEGSVSMNKKPSAEFEEIQVIAHKLKHLQSKK